MAVSSIPAAPPPSKAIKAVEDARKLANETLSPVQRALQEKKTATAKQVNYFESEGYLRMKANEIKYRINLYKNLGLAPEYQAAQQEGTEVVKKYQAILAKQLKTKGASDTTA